LTVTGLARILKPSHQKNEGDDETDPDEPRKYRRQPLVAQEDHDAQRCNNGQKLAEHDAFAIIATRIKVQLEADDHDEDAQNDQGDSQENLPFSSNPVVG